MTRADFEVWIKYFDLALDGSAAINEVSSKIVRTASDIAFCALDKVKAVSATVDKEPVI